MMTIPYGNYVEIPGPKPKNLEALIPEHFKHLYNSLMEGIYQNDGEPDFETLRIIIHYPSEENGNATTVALRIDATYKEHFMFEEKINEQKASIEGTGKNN